MALYDDTLRNLMRLLEDDSPASRSVLFRHLCDLIVQNRPIVRNGHRTAILALLERILPSTELLARMEVAEQLCTITRPPIDLAAILVHDDITVARWILDRAQLEDKDWLNLIPKLDGERLARLAKRKGLSPNIRESLLDALEPGTQQVTAVHLSKSEQQIEDLLGRLGRNNNIRRKIPLKSRTAVANTTDARHSPDRATRLFQETSKSPASPVSIEDEELDPRLFGADGLWECDRFGILTFTSSAHAELLGQPAERLGGQAIDHLLDLTPDMTDLFKAQRPFEGAAQLNADKTQSWAIRAVPVFNHRHGAFDGYRGTIELVTNTNTETKPFDNVNALQHRKPADLAHEIRTPLNAIRGFAEMIESEIWGPVAPAYRHRSQKIINESARLDLLVMDLLDMGRIEEGRMDVELNACDMRLIIEDLCSHLSPRDKERLNIIFGETTPPIWGEFRLLSRVISKLVRAGAHWTPIGQPVALQITSTGDSQLRCQIPLPLLEKRMPLKALMRDTGDNAHPLLETPIGYGLGVDFAAQLVDFLAGEIRLIQNPQDQYILLLSLNASTQG